MSLAEQADVKQRVEVDLDDAVTAGSRLAG